jgi:hypothetical protein
LFLVFFAVFSRCLAWDWIMSIDTHWFSTLLWLVRLRRHVGERHDHGGHPWPCTSSAKAYLPQVNNSHIHDMGKWVFAISFLWSYLYFSQFMLIWYSNIPRRSPTSNSGSTIIRWLMWGMFFINFAVPMVMLMSRDAKRNPRFLIGVGSVIFVGHWLDVNMMVMPGCAWTRFPRDRPAGGRYVHGLPGCVHSYRPERPDQGTAHRGEPPVPGRKRTPPDLNQTVPRTT